MRGAGLAAGVVAGAAAIVAAWGAGLVDPPERVSRALAVLSAAYPASPRDAFVERIPCPPLRSLRLYVVCTKECEEIWEVVGVRGLWTDNLAHPGRVPEQPIEESRARIAAAVAKEALALDVESAREMAVCYLRIEGWLPDLVLAPADRVALDQARGDDDAQARLAASFAAREDARSRIEVDPDGDGYRARLEYWDTSAWGRPVLGMTLALGANGVLRSFEIEERVTDGTGSGSTPGIPPS